MRIIRSIVILVSSCISLCYSILFFTLKLPTLYSYDVIVFMLEGGFGHAVTAPDLVRRMYKGKKCCLIVFAESGRSNWKSRYLWSDIDVFFLPLSIGLMLGKKKYNIVCPFWHKEHATLFFLRIVTAICRKSIVYSNFVVYADAANYVNIKDEIKLPENFIPSGHGWPIGYFALMRDVAVDKVFLPEKIRKKIRKKIGRVCEKKLCCLYLRQKGIVKQDTDSTNASRIGSDLTCYSKAIDLLNEHGYFVLLTGDVLLPYAYNGCVDAAAVGIDKDWFDLFAATEADIFIGEAGGGSWLSGINGIPRLLVNAFPFGYGLPGSFVFYKTLYDSQGKKIDINRCLKENLYQYTFSGFELRSNTEDELYAAVERFLLTKDELHDTHYKCPVKGLSEYSWLYQSRARLLSLDVK